MHTHDALDFAELAATLQSAQTPIETAEDIVRFVRAQLGADRAGISVIRRNRLETIAPTDRLVEDLDRLQSELGEGPCYDASWPGETLTAFNIAEDERWPTWAAKAAALGIVSLLATELTTGECHRIGCISIYWTTHHRCFTQDDITFMAIFARHAALALSRSWNEAGLNTALDSRKLIGQAQGILMERHGLDADRAFEVLRSYSQDHNIKLRTVAANLIETRQLPAFDKAAQQSRSQKSTASPSPATKPTTTPSSTSYYRMSSDHTIEAARQRLLREPHQSPARVLGYANRHILRVDYRPGRPPDSIIHNIEPPGATTPHPRQLKSTNPAHRSDRAHDHDHALHRWARVDQDRLLILVRSGPLLA